MRILEKSFQKITTRYFKQEGEDVQELKLKYYNLMVKLDMGEKKYLAVSQHFQQINQTPIVTNNAAKVLFRIKIFGKKNSGDRVIYLMRTILRFGRDQPRPAVASERVEGGQAAGRVGRLQATLDHVHHAGVDELDQH